MTTSITAFTCGFSDSPLRLPYALAVYACGHSGRVETTPTRYACAGCGAASTDCGRRCACGYVGGYRIVEIANPHNQEHRLAQIGDVVDCQQCDDEQQQLEWLRGLQPSDIQHARYREWCGVGQYHFYRRDASSPTGVISIGTVSATSAVEVVLREKRINPLSPTEAR